MVYVKVVNRFTEQTNNTARLRLENVYFTFYGGHKQVTTIFFSPSELGYGSWVFNPRGVRLHLAN